MKTQAQSDAGHSPQAQSWNKKKNAPTDEETKKFIISPFKTWNLAKLRLTPLNFFHFCEPRDSVLFKLAWDGFLCCLQIKSSDESY